MKLVPPTAAESDIRQCLRNLEEEIPDRTAEECVELWEWLRAVDRQSSSPQVRVLRWRVMMRIDLLARNPHADTATAINTQQCLRLIVALEE